MPLISFDISDKVAAQLSEHAKKHGYSRTAYAQMLFDAAYAARFGFHDDRDLKSKVELVLVLHAARLDSQVIAQAVGLSESTVERIKNAWRVNMSSKKD